MNQEQQNQANRQTQQNPRAAGTPANGQVRLVRDQPKTPGAETEKYVAEAQVANEEKDGWRRG